jgi:thymidylate synthase
MLNFYDPELLIKFLSEQLHNEGRKVEIHRVKQGTYEHMGYSIRIPFLIDSKWTKLHDGSEYANDYHHFTSYFETLIDQAREDISSRQLIALNWRRDAPTDCTPCIVMIQFLIRDAKVNAIAFIRSSDMPNKLLYDIGFLKSLTEEFKDRLQECFEDTSLLLNLGSLIIHFGSLHEYI